MSASWLVENPGTEDAAGPRRVRKGRYDYRRRRPEQGALYRIVQDNLETLYAAVEDGFAAASLPQFVRDELERFLDCGLLCRGAALMGCESEGCSGIRWWLCPAEGGGSARRASGEE